MSCSPLNFQDFEKNISLSSLSSQDFCIELLFLLSIVKILLNNFSVSSQFSRFCKTISLFPLDFQDFVEQLISPLDTQDIVPFSLS